MANLAIYPHELTGRTIRLLTVEPDEPSAKLRCTLSETCLETTPTVYNALSYCWGANHSPVQITCNSHPLSVTPNLHSVLLEYRRREITTPLWVDAICINQSNISERTSQVRMMDRIYTEAECVVVWLGEAEATDGLALKCLKNINARWTDSKDVPILPTGQDALDYDAWLSPKLPQEQFDALAAFLLRPWFSRMWIIQELVLARQVTIWCGPATMDEEFPILEAIARLSQMINCVYRTQEAVKSFNDKDARRAGRFKLSCATALFSIKYGREKALIGTLYLFMMTRWFDATDPRDKVFALVGLTSDIDKSFVDYSKSYEDVMKELNIMLLDGRIEPTMGSVLDIWSLLTREENEEITEPSWVVDLFKARYSMCTAMVTGYPSIEPNIERKPEIQFPTEGGDESLHVRGTVFDTITQTAPFPKFMSEIELRNTNDLQNISSYREWILRVGALMQRPDDTDTDGIYRATGESHYEAFWRTLCCNRTSFSAYDPPEDGSGYDAYLAHLRVLELQLGYEHTKSKAWYLGIATAFSSSLSYCFRRRNWFLRIAVPLAIPLLTHLFNVAWSRNWAVLQGQLQSHQRDFESMHMQWMQGRQFAITKQGLIGLVPIAARVGDSVGFFAGCRVPFALRRRGEGYALVGDSYLHGVMNGEGELKETEMLKIV